MQGFRILLTLLLGLLIVDGSRALAQEVLAVVNGDSITTTDVDDIFSTIHDSMSNNSKMKFDYRKLVDKLVNDRLIIQEANAIGMADEDSFLKFMERERDKNVERCFAKNYYKFNKKVSDDEIKDYFDKKYFKVQIRTIATLSRSKADSLRQMIAAGAPMDSLAKTNSVDVHRYQGGAHSLMYYAEIENELRTHLPDPKEGQLIGPFPYHDAYVLMRVDQVTPADETELPSLQNYIRSVLKINKQKADWLAFVDSLEQQLGVTRNNERAKAIASDAEAVLDSTFLIGTNDVVATIGETGKLTDSELRLATARLAMNAANAPKDSLVTAAIDQWLQQQALLQSGVAAGLENDPKVVAALDKTRDSALVEIYLKETVVSQITFNRDEFTKYYNEHQDDFREPGKLQLRSIIIADKAGADSAYQLLKDGSDFDYVTDRFVTGDPRVMEKTDWTTLNAFPEEIRDNLDSLQIGASSRPFPTSDGWIIFRLLDKKQGRLKSLDEVELAIRQIMFQRQFNSLLDKALAVLKDHSEITYFDKAIDRYLGESR